MDNYAIAENFSLLSKLMDIHGDNSFKARIYGAAAFNIEKLPNQLADTPPEKIASIKGIGESTAKKIAEMLETGKLAILHEYIAKTPPGVIEMLNIKGIGPKKIQTIWKEMGIESVGELLYACNENRLTLYKGFGEKTQANVQESIEFYQSQQGHFLYAEAEAIFPQVNAYLQKIFSPETVHVTGAYRRQALTIEEMEFVVLENNDVIKPKFQTAQPPELLEEKDNTILYKLKNGLKLRLHTGKGNMDERLFTTSCSEEFLTAFTSSFPSVKYSGKEIGDDSVFAQAKICVIPAYLRETAGIIEKARQNKFPKLIQPEDIKAIIHSHSKWSDGDNNLEQMAEECIRRGLEYLVISDHSKTAVYANGLTEERIREQHRQIDQLNEQYKAVSAGRQAFKIFKSIECDILGDGSMDYSNNILSTFDLVIASVHSNLKMTEEKAMMRLMKAIENPYTAILGHMTGRLLLSRNGYPVDHKKIIDACAANNVVIELNAHPRRLDIDWRYIDYAIDKGVLISIDPDAHSLDGYNDTRYGVLAAQKAGLTKEQNLSSFSLTEFEKFLVERKKKKKI
ncbi:MAG TPA: helix-hairpin-helix domain-containing protein [Chitinophagaceae bacterium]|nr:helix-hairpin-helix domain-containing protein [Chitinophagaceae bacterium]